jgi:hypothetical protein
MLWKSMANDLRLLEERKGIMKTEWPTPEESDDAPPTQASGSGDGALEWLAKEIANSSCVYCREGIETFPGRNDHLWHPLTHYGKPIDPEPCTSIAPSLVAKIGPRVAELERKCAALPKLVEALRNTATGRPYEHGPTGTNLFDASQAEEMVRYMLKGIAALPTRSEAQSMTESELFRAAQLWLSENVRPMFNSDQVKSLAVLLGKMQIGRSEAQIRAQALEEGYKAAIKDAKERLDHLGDMDDNDDCAFTLKQAAKSISQLDRKLAGAQ